MLFELRSRKPTHAPAHTEGSDQTPLLVLLPEQPSFNTNVFLRRSFHCVPHPAPVSGVVKSRVEPAMLEKFSLNDVKMMGSCYGRNACCLLRRRAIAESMLNSFLRKSA